MSRYSGKCDLCDLIAGSAGWYDSDGNPVTVNSQDGHGPLYGNELEDFKEFKKKTGGVLYQNVCIKLTPFNAEFLATQNDQFKVITKTEEVVDKRTKTGKRIKTKTTYSLYEEIYTIAEINKLFGGIQVKTEIHFDTLFELAHYYSHLVSMVASSEDKMVVFITETSYVDMAYEQGLRAGHKLNSRDYYKKLLMEHLKEIAVLGY